MKSRQYELINVHYILYKSCSAYQLTYRPASEQHVRLELEPSFLYIQKMTPADGRSIGEWNLFFHVFKCIASTV